MKSLLYLLMFILSETYGQCTFHLWVVEDQTLKPVKGIGIRRIPQGIPLRSFYGVTDSAGRLDVILSQEETDSLFMFSNAILYLRIYNSAYWKTVCMPILEIRKRQDCDYVVIRLTKN